MRRASPIRANNLVLVVVVAALSAKPITESEALPPPNVAIYTPPWNGIFIFIIFIGSRWPGRTPAPRPWLLRTPKLPNSRTPRGPWLLRTPKLPNSRIPRAPRRRRRRRRRRRERGRGESGRTWLQNGTLGDSLRLVVDLHQGSLVDVGGNFQTPKHPHALPMRQRVLV